MRLLLDTHALLWWLKDDVQLGRNARDLIADAENDILVSTVSLWEIVVKLRIGKLAADVHEIDDAIDTNRFARIGIERMHLAALATLPRYADHRDPFDHLLVAQAVAERAAFLSADRNARRYPVDVVPCSDEPGA